MSLREPRVTKQCPQCKELHQSRHSKYCSVMCEEGRRAPPISEPSSQGYHLHLQGEPEALVGRTLIARAYKFTDDVTEDWHKSLDDLPTVWVAEDGESAVYKTDTVVGKVYDYDGKCYHVEDDLRSGAVVTRRIPASSVVSLIRTDTWWAE